MTKWCFCFILLCFALPAQAADYYIAPIQTGLNNASSCSNAKASSWDWTSPNVVAGDTVYLCPGGYKSTFTIPQSYLATVTVKFMSGAIFSKDLWGVDGQAAIRSNGKNYITIDGDNVGIIENTANGTGLVSHADSEGICIIDSNNWTIKNITIRDIYTRISTVGQTDADSHKTGYGIKAVNANGLLIDNVTISNAYYGVWAYTSGSNTSGTTIQNSSIFKCSTGIVLSLESAHNYTGIIIIGNHIYDGYIWGNGCWQTSTPCDTWNHSNGIHTWGNRAGNTLAVTIANNQIGGSIGEHTTGLVYLTDYTTPAIVYNNELVWVDYAPSSGGIAYHSASNAATFEAYNNTIIGLGTASGSGTGIYTTGTATSTSTLKNNLIHNCNVGIRKGTGTTLTSSNNLLVVEATRTGQLQTGDAFKTLAEWQILGYDTDVITSGPLLDSTYHPTYLSPAINAGADLSATFTTDKDGVPWAGRWGIGAYKFNKAVISIGP